MILKSVKSLKVSGPLPAESWPWIGSSLGIHPLECEAGLVETHLRILGYFPNSLQSGHFRSPCGLSSLTLGLSVRSYPVEAMSTPPRTAKIVLSMSPAMTVLAFHHTWQQVVPARVILSSRLRSSPFFYPGSSQHWV